MKTTLKQKMKILPATISGLMLAGVMSAPVVFAAGEPTMQDGVKKAPYDPSVFKKDPSYEDKPYDVEKQLKIYGDKRANENPRPLLELGRRIYDVGLFDEPSYALGKKNPINHQFAIYGDWRTAIAYNDNGGSNHQAVLATRLNLDFDYKFTSTERIHAVMTPLEKDNRFTRHIISGPGSKKTESEFDPNLDALYLEGDLGAITAGLTDEYTTWDLPFAIGLMPLQYQNGIWVDDAFRGFAFTIPAKNSPALNISNMDVTFFAGFDDVSGPIKDTGGNTVDTGDVHIYGVTAFIEANEGYWEMGYGYTNGRKTFDDQDYHNVAIAFTRRYGGWLSNSVRLISNFGQDRAAGLRKTADGHVILIENSLITSKPSTLIPYMNFFAGYDQPQSLARAAGAGGILRNTGILFESDGLTGFPTLDASANDTYGGALGVEYLFGLDQQLVVEIAGVKIHGDDPGRIAQGSMACIGVRYQRPLDRKWIFRADAMAADRKNAETISGIRFELRRKF